MRNRGGSWEPHRIINGDCVQVMEQQFPTGSVDFILTDPPYMVNYRSRDGRAVPNDDNDRWLYSAFDEMSRVLKDNRFCVSFYGWTQADKFLAAWRAAGFRPIGHLVFPKQYTSGTGYCQYQHEQAYVLAKGNPKEPDSPIGDVIPWTYTGNRLHPTQKPVEILTPLIASFSRPGDLVLDPFCGSGSSLVAAHLLGRNSLGIELDQKYAAIAQRRLEALRPQHHRCEEAPAVRYGSMRRQNQSFDQTTSYAHNEPASRGRFDGTAAGYTPRSSVYGGR